MNVLCLSANLNNHFFMKKGSYLNFTIMLTQNCNMHCSYCYELHKNRAINMSETTLDQTIDFISARYTSNPSEQMFINFCGGEPLIEFRKIKYLMEQIKLRTKHYSITPPAYEISTNATLINSSMLEHFNRHKVLYYVGFDGIKESFNKNRVFYGQKKGGFKKVYNNIRKMLREGVMGTNITLNIVITENNLIHLLDNILFMNNIDNGITLSINIAYNLEWNKKSLELFKNKAEELLDFYKNRILVNNSFSIKFIDDRVRRLLYARSMTPAEHCGAAKNCYTILTNGEIIGCAMLAYSTNNRDEIILGNVIDGIDSKRVQNFRRSLNYINHDECKRCDLYEICMNYCIAFNCIGSGEMINISHSICETEKIVLYKCFEMIQNLKLESPETLFSKYGFKENL